MAAPDIRTVNVIRYIQPLREGGSLPAMVEADDGFHYVLKFRGAGQGKKALIAELIGGELARVIGLRVPELVFMDLDDSFARSEPDEEIQDLLKFSIGLNLGVHFLSGAITYDPVVSVASPMEASLVVLLDSMITNIDRTVRNTNLLNWKRELWLIDHGASLYFHHNWGDWKAHARRPFPLIKEHVLLPRATQLDQAAATIKDQLNTQVFTDIVSVIPDDFLDETSDDLTPESKRLAYVGYLQLRLERLDFLTKEAADARQ